MSIGIGYQSTWNEWNCDIEDFTFNIYNWGRDKSIVLKIKDKDILRIPIKEFDREWIRFAGDGWTHFSVSCKHFYKTGDEYGSYNDL